MKQYLQLLREVKDKGVARDTRTGIGTKAVFGRQLVFDLAEGFPLLTTKRVHFKSVLHELLWFVRGDTNLRYLHEHGVTIWDEWADANGDLGPIYGAQWRDWRDEHGHSHDQLANLVHMIRTDPDSRRMLLSTWNVGQLAQMKLMPCHVLLQAWVHAGNLDIQVYQRSCDIFLGMPFNIASYALLQHMLAQVTGLVPGRLVYSFGDVHLYDNHATQAATQLGREPRALPRLHLDESAREIDDFTHAHIRLDGYAPHSRLPASVAV